MQNNANIGTVDRYVRLSAGLLALGAGASMRRQGALRAILLSVGAMKVAEGVTGWCPLIHLAQSATGQSAASGQQTSSDQEAKAQPQKQSTTSAKQEGNESQNGHTHDGRTHQSSPLQ